MDVRGKVTIITGASSGIGLAAARLFARHGAKVALVARSADVLDSIVKELRGMGYEANTFPTDVSKKEDVERMVEAVYQKYERIDILVNNAGQGASGEVSVVSNDDFHRIIELNLFGPLYGMQAVVPKMKAHSGGVIINISSMVTKLRIPGIGAYASTKAALNQLSHTARIELAPDNIRVVTLYPGLVATNFGKNMLGARAGGGFGGDGARPELIAEKILAAAQKEPRDQYVGIGLRIFGFLSDVAPKLVDRLISSRIQKQQQPAQDSTIPVSTR